MSEVLGSRAPYGFTYTQMRPTGSPQCLEDNWCEYGNHITEEAIWTATTHWRGLESTKICMSCYLRYGK